ncbi:helix-turn-helix domain-containing protein [Agromyces silvae]|uniref:helix-turn-helix domain-containing protein n=1 Tax=Agromyces silvae TaxID=3388266 RepID=UPI00280ACA08|nr:helix-turn-helix transcriptional regulator [Agromyces protaetiae]
MPSVPTHRAAFGARVRELRTARGWSQEEFAHRADLDRTYVSGVERGVRNPTLDVINHLAKALGVDVMEFFSR